MVKNTGGGLVVKRPGVLSKVQRLTLVLGVGVFSLLPIMRSRPLHNIILSELFYVIISVGGGYEFHGQFLDKVLLSRGCRGCKIPSKLRNII